MAQIAGKKISGGFGMMGFTWRNPRTPEDQAFEALRETLACGANFWNGGEFYGPPEYNSLHLLNAYFTKYPDDADKVVISIKGGANPKTHQPDGSPENVRRSVDECLKVLDGKKFLDSFECARVDQHTPVETTIATLAEYVKAGKLGAITLSECSANTIRRAAKVHKISGVEVEFSLFATEIVENGVMAACAELDIPVIAYSPLGRGFLTGQLKGVQDLSDDDPRKHNPRMSPENFEKNMVLVREVEKIAKKKGCTVGQVAIAWCKGYQSRPGMPTIIPIPGATAASRVRENYTEVTLSSQEMDELDQIVKTCTVHGDRYPPHINAWNFGDSPLP